MASAFVSIQPERLKHGLHTEATPIESLLRVAASDDAADWVHRVKSDAKHASGSDFHPELKGTGLQLESAKVIDAGHPLFLELPSWLDSLTVPEALASMHQVCAIVYLVSAGAPNAAERGDFFVLHLLTAMWGLGQVVHALPDEAPQRDACKCFWASALAMTMAHFNGFPAAGDLRRTWEAYNMCDGSRVAAGARSWEQIVESLQKQDEEHNMKLVRSCAGPCHVADCDAVRYVLGTCDACQQRSARVQCAHVYVARELWRRSNGWRGFHAAAQCFTPVPGVGPGRAPFMSQK
jgi:Questin oxidase-like